MRIVAIFLILSFFVTGCSSVRTYTFKRDRVDQEIEEGNRGYLEGTPPPAESREGLKRTMIGVDVEIPVLPWEKGVSIPPEPSDDKVEVPPKEDEKTVFEIPKSKSKPRTIKGETVEDESEWIK